MRWWHKWNNTVRKNKCGVAKQKKADIFAWILLKIENDVDADLTALFCDVRFLLLDLPASIFVLKETKYFIEAIPLLWLCCQLILFRFNTSFNFGWKFRLKHNFYAPSNLHVFVYYISLRFVLDVTFMEFSFLIYFDVHGLAFFFCLSLYVELFVCMFKVIS